MTRRRHKALVSLALSINGANVLLVARKMLEKRLAENTIVSVA